MTMGETWIHHFTPESNRQSAECTAAGESCLKQPKTQTSAGKVLASIFWDAQGILFNEFGAFEGRNCQKTATNEEEKVLFHQDNALFLKSITMMAKLHESHFKLLLHPPYSIDLVPSNYWLFADLKRMLQGKRFGAKDKLFNKKVIELLEKCWNQSP